MSGLVQSERLDRFLRIERPVADESHDAAGQGQWETVAENVRAEVQDALPSRAERMAGGITASNRPARVRMRWRTDVSGNMRFVIGDRVMQIVSGPAELGRRDGLEFMVEEWSPAGGGA